MRAVRTSRRRHLRLDHRLSRTWRSAVGAALAVGLLVVTASAGAAVTYRSAGGVCETASLYANYSPSGGPKNKIGVVVLGEVVGFVDSNGSWAIVRTGSGGAPAGFVLRECITVPEAGSSGSYLWPAKIACQNATAYANYDSKTHKPEHDFAVLRRGQRIGYQYYTAISRPVAWRASVKARRRRGLRIRTARVRRRRQLGAERQLEPARPR